MLNVDEKKNKMNVELLLWHVAVTAWYTLIASLCFGLALIVLVWAIKQALAIAYEK